MKTIFSTFFHD